MSEFFFRKHLLPRLRRWTAQPGWQHPVHALDGGIDPPDFKQVSLRQKPVTMPSAELPLPPELIIPLQQHQGPVSRPVVAVGDFVRKNQRIAGAVGERGVHHHAPASGRVLSIDRPVAVGAPAAAGTRTWQHGLYRQVPAIVIAPDNEQESGSDNPFVSADNLDWQQLSPAQLLQRVIDAGVCGMGGAGFPAASKLASPAIETIIINGAECEPWITADEALMQHEPGQILQGARIIAAITGARQCLLAIEDNKKEAISAMQQALSAMNTADIQLVLIPSLYPSGSEKQLVRIVTGVEIPSGKHPTDVGVLCHSVATAKAVADAVLHQQPLIARMTTITGPGIVRPQNIYALIGTPIESLLSFAGLAPSVTRETPVLIGGPLMGYPVPSTDNPLIKTANCVLVDKNNEASEQLPHRDCIRCDFCADACPVKLQPQTLYFMARHQRHEQAQAHALFDCIECGACAAVCPSKIPLIAYYREEKAAIRELNAAQSQSRHWQQAYDHHRARMQTLAVEQEQRRLEKLQHKLQALDQGETLSRAPAVKMFDPKPPTPAPEISDTLTDSTSPMPAIKTPEQIRVDIEAAVARTRARKAALQQAKSDTATGQPPKDDTR